jgi:epoxyqueuosine reductase
LINKTIDATKCISYFTIELKSNELPDGLEKKSENWIFGCDICQDVCPWNRFSETTEHQELNPYPEILHFGIREWDNLSEENFNVIFKNSPLKRTGFKGLKRNLKLFQQ